MRFRYLSLAAICAAAFAMPASAHHSHNAYEVTVNADMATFTGAGEGHGMGLCQRGAAGLARQGVSWRDILHHYFPAALIR